MHIAPIEILKSLAFALATLTATGALVAAGLNEPEQAAATPAKVMMTVDADRHEDSVSAAGARAVVGGN